MTKNKNPYKNIKKVTNLINLMKMSYRYHYFKKVNNFLQLSWNMLMERRYKNQNQNQKVYQKNIKVQRKII